ncbi:MAG TPA: hypothetical protein VF062_29935, partial [Candidatus Limnocylindrales bacterium]
AAMGDKDVVVWDLATGSEVQRLTPPLSVVSSGRSTLEFSPDGTMLAKGGEDGTAHLHLWRLDTGRLTRLTGHDDGVVAVAFHPDGSVLASAGLDGRVVLWDPATGSELATAGDHPGGILAAQFSGDGRWLATAASTGVVALRDPRNGTVVATIGHPDAVRSLAFSRDGALLATGCDDRTARLFTRLDGRTGP